MQTVREPGSRVSGLEMGVGPPTKEDGTCKIGLAWGLRRVWRRLWSFWRLRIWPAAWIDITVVMLFGNLTWRSQPGHGHLYPSSEVYFSRPAIPRIRLPRETQGEELPVWQNRAADTGTSGKPDQFNRGGFLYIRGRDHGRV